MRKVKNCVLRKGQTALNILIVNDDGVNEYGIRCLAEYLNTREDKNVYVCGPATQQSGKGNSISFGFPVKIERLHDHSVCGCWACSGTPADCTKLGIMALKKEGIEVDLVLSGVNAGVNLGTDTYYSGTVGGAREGNLCGKPAMAVSVGTSRKLEGDPDYGYICRFICRIIDEHYDKMNSSFLLNINFPAIPEKDIKGVNITRLGIKEDYDIHVPIDSIKKEGGYEFQWLEKPQISTDRGIDIVSVQDGYVSITPLSLDPTDSSLAEKVKTWKVFA